MTHTSIPKKKKRSSRSKIWNTQNNEDGSRYLLYVFCSWAQQMVYMYIIGLFPQVGWHMADNDILTWNLGYTCTESLEHWSECRL